MADNFDLVVIGSGPGGYVAAIKAAQLGLSVACVEKRATYGGTCLNVGCIPSKALLASSEKFEEANHALAEHGVKLGKVELDLAQMMKRKDKVVLANTKGVEFLFKKNKITGVIGYGRLTGANEVTVDLAAGGTRVLTAKNILIATGSESLSLPGVEIDEKTICSSTGGLTLDKVPGHLVVIGGGYIGLEMGSVWKRLGAKVTVVEFLDRITPSMDAEVAKELQKTLTKQGLVFKLGTKVTKVTKTKAGVALTVEPAAGGAAETIDCDVVLVSIGRRPFTDGLGLEKVGVKLDSKGRIETDGHYRTNVPGVWAIGDVIAGPMLAHKAEDEGVAVAELLVGQAGHVNYGVIPAVVYTWPEVASVGLTEEEVKATGAAYVVGKFPFMANGRARANGDNDGFVKLIADKATDRVLGAHIIGPDAGTLIHEIAVGMEFSCAAEDIARTCHAHPTLNEAVREAAFAVGGSPIHM
ncbi:MAG: dihydrolipoyl dehydrogenase [Elsteraceae bacterium]